ncbi:unnamed protein product [Lymnaea stagnalis]|uniref:Uncharacterized protein n=1 Tax=Lymnaea stagnalis TaxID=6523 RepID=A0AAV2HT15_LYMST
MSEISIPLKALETNMACSDFLKKFTVQETDGAESFMERGITLPVCFKEESLTITVYGKEPIHQVKDIWQIKRPDVNFQNYEIVLHFKDHRVEIVEDHEEVDDARLLEVEFIRISQAGFHHNVPVNLDTMLVKQIGMKY